MPQELNIVHIGDCVICGVKKPEGRSPLCDDCIFEVYDYSIMGTKTYQNEMIGCPLCGLINDAKSWDRYTRDNWELHEMVIYPWIIVKKEIHEKLGLRYRCPSCNKVVGGTSLLRMND